MRQFVNFPHDGDELPVARLGNITVVAPRVDAFERCRNRAERLHRSGGKPPGKQRRNGKRQQGAGQEPRQQRPDVPVKILNAGGKPHNVAVRQFFRRVKHVDAHGGGAADGFAVACFQGRLKFRAALVVLHLCRVGVAVAEDMPVRRDEGNPQRVRRNVRHFFGERAVVGCVLCDGNDVQQLAHLVFAHVEVLLLHDVGRKNSRDEQSRKRDQQAAEQECPFHVVPPL